MVAPIQSLMNMEMALYGGVGTNTNAPSYANGYAGGSSYYNDLNSSLFNYNNLSSTASNPAFTAYGYGYGNGYGNSFGQNIPSQYMSQTQSQPQNAGAFSGLSNDQVKTITDYYAKNLEPSESLSNALIMGTVMGGMMLNPRVIAHPINTLTSFKDVKNIFKDVRVDGSKLNKLWRENSYIMEEAYAETQRLTARSKWKIGAFRKRYTEAEYKQLLGIMDDAVKKGNIDEIAKATETLKHAYVNNGFMPRLWDKIRGKDTVTVASRIADTATIDTNVKQLKSFSKMDFKKAFEKTGGKMGLAFGALEIFMNFGKIKTAFAKDKENEQKGIDTNYGSKQTMQTVVKATGNTLGYAAGETLGVWAAAKYGAKIGTRFGGLTGTLIGAVAGVACGSIGMWIAGKGTRAIVGDDVVNKIEAEKMLATAEGQQQLLINVAETMQKDKNVDQRTVNAVASAMSLYA